MIQHWTSADWSSFFEHWVVTVETWKGEERKFNPSHLPVADLGLQNARGGMQTLEAYELALPQLF